MGNYKRYLDLVENEQDLRSLVCTIAKLHQFTILQESKFDKVSDKRQQDLQLMHDGNIVTAEIILDISAEVGETQLRSAVGQLALRMRSEGAHHGVLAITAFIDPTTVDAMTGELPIEIWDLERLARLAENDEGASEELAYLIRNAGIGMEGAGRMSDKVALLLAELDRNEDRLRALTIIDQLNRSEIGRGQQALDFERLCAAALTELFGKHFGELRRQHRVADGFHRLDAIAALRPYNSFWSGLAHDFRTRYVVFEFKNNENPVTQDEIYTTEKYLFLTALRSVAIMITRSGASESANHAIRGALRESGKLILCFSMKNLIDMLHRKASGGDPDAVVADKLDHLLTTIAR